MLKYLSFLTILTLSGCTEYKKVKLYSSDPIKGQVVHAEERIACDSTYFYNYYCMSMNDTLNLLDRCEKRWWEKLW